MVDVNAIFLRFDMFVDAFEDQLLEDQRRWGDTWTSRPQEGQEDRIMSRLMDYWDQYRNAGTPIPWLKVIGLAYIAWLRENYPELLEVESVG